MKRIAVFGCGLVGSAIARDLASVFEVTAIDRDEAALARVRAVSPVTTLVADFSNPATVSEIASRFDLAVGAVPGFLGKQTLAAIIEASRDVVDISFFPEDPFELDELARLRNVTAVVDMGVAPGMSNVLLGNATRHFTRVDSFECMVGGLPVEREWPFEYKAPFSPADVLEEYKRPARYIERGVETVRPPLLDPELVYFPGVGTLEAFTTDGLRTLIKTLPVQTMKEKTLRYPGHARFMLALNEAGFLDSEPVEVSGQSIRPIDFTSRLIFPKWQLRQGQEEFTLMRVVIGGETGEGRAETVTWSLLDRYDSVSDVTSMARTTGYACTAAVTLVSDGVFRRKGICPPEFLGLEDKCFRFLLGYQEARGIRYNRTVAPTPRP